MKRTTFFLWILAMTWNASSQDLSQEIDLQSCVTAAIQHHPATRNTELLLQKFAYQAEVINSAWFPQTFLNLQGTYQSDVVSLDLGVDIPGLNLPEIPHLQFKTTADINQLLYDGGRVNSQKQVNNREKELSLLEIEQIQYKIRQVVEDVYFSLLKLKSQLPVLDYQAEAMDVLEKEVTKRVKEGMALVSDRDLIEVNRIELEIQRSNIESLISAQIEALQKLTGMNLEDDIRFQIPQVPELSDQQFIRPDVISFQAQQNLLAAKSEQLGTLRKPTIGVFSQLGYGRPGLNFFSETPDVFFIGGLKASWNIYDWQKNQKQRSVIELQSKILGNNQEALEQELDLQVIHAAAAINQKEDQLYKDRLLIELYQKIALNSETQYQGGVILLSEYIQRLNQLKIARQQLELGTVELAELKKKLNTLRNAN